MINELLKPENKDITDKLNIHILPMANPDGYEYSRNNDRHWRKNRGINPGSTCKGVDLNRNWGFHWGGQLHSSYTMQRTWS
jgi:murein tripeptide amidase MpaA